MGEVDAAVLPPAAARQREGLLNAGLAAADAGDPHAAASHFRAMLEADPADALAHKNLGAMLLEQAGGARAERTAEALGHLRQAVRSAPRWADARFDLGVALQRSDDHAGAMRHYQLALALDPEHASAHCAFMRITQEICDWAHLEELWARSRHFLAGERRALPGVLTPFTVPSMPSTPAEQQEAARRWVAGCGLAMPERPHWKQFGTTGRRDGAQTRPLRVGYIAADFRDDPVTAQVIGALEHHDRARVQVAGYCIGGPDSSTLRQRSMAACDSWTELAQASVHDAARRIAEDGIDVLVDLQGYTQGCRTEILVLRPAPVQVSWIGYPGTMGAPFIDYVLTDRYLTPPQQARYWDERFSYLPDCYMPADAQRAIAERPSRAECGLPEQGFVFCCFNHTIKIHPRVFDVWMGLLRRTPASVLWLFAYHPCAPNQLRAEAAARGVDPERLVFSDLRPHPEYLARMQAADLFVDTWPYNAGATCNDALWAGLPVLTLRSQTYIGRMAASQLRAVGLPDMVATSERQYERYALELATSRAALAGVRLRLAQGRRRAPLFAMPRYTRNLEDAYGRMVAAL